MSSLPRVDLKPIAGLRQPVSLRTHAPQVDLVSRRLHADGAWEPFETHLWLASQRAGDIVVDVGANLGYFALLSALCERRASQILAFEPDSQNFALLEDNLHLNGVADEVQGFQVALASASGEGTLYRSRDNLGDHQIYAGDGEREALTISLAVGREFLSERVERIDLLKIDTQGSEFSVIEGLGTVLESSRVGLRLLIELTPFSLRCAGASGRQLVERLRDLDLPIAIVDHIEHRLVPTSVEALATWCDNVDSIPEDRGFMNVFVGEPPDL